MRVSIHAPREGSDSKNAQKFNTSVSTLHNLHGKFADFTRKAQKTQTLFHTFAVRSAREKAVRLTFALNHQRVLGIVAGFCPEVLDTAAVTVAKIVKAQAVCLDINELHENILHLAILRGV